MDEQQFFKEQTDKNTFLQILERYLPFWPLFVITTTLSVAVTFVYLRSQVPIYVASAKVLIKDPNKGSGDSKVLDALNIFGDKKIVENEIVVLQSTSLMQEVVRELNLYGNVYNEGKVRIEELYKGNSPLTFITATPDSIQPSGKYYFTVDWNRNLVHINNKDVHFNDSVLLSNAVFKIEANPSYPHNLTGKNYYVQFNSIEGAAGGIIGDLKASAISNQSTVINLRIETPVQEKGRDVLNRLFEVYNATAIMDKNQTAAKTLAFIDNRLGIVTGQLDTVERNIESYKKQNQVVDLGIQGQLFLERIKDYDKSKSDIQIKLEVLNDINNYVNGHGAKQSAIPSLSLLNDPLLTSMVTGLYDAEFQLDRARKLSGEKSDAVILAQEQLDRLRGAVRENLITARTNLISARNNVNSIINSSSSVLSRIPLQERGLIDVSRQQAIKNNIYTYLLQKREETALNSASTIADLRVIERASSYGPIKPVSKNYYLAGLVIGVLIAVFIILVREQFNRKVLFTSEIEEKTRVPIVGEIIQVASKTPIVIQEGKRTIIAEQFRSLRTNLSFMALSEDAKTALITSNISGEGKSFISINLAISYTLTDKKVALLELDLRKPRLSNLLNVARDPGISNYLFCKIPI